MVRVVGALLVFIGLAILLCALLCLLYREEDLGAMLAAALATLLTGTTMFAATGKKSRRVELSHREAFAIATLGWIASCLAGALPFFLFAHMPALFYPDAAQQAWQEAHSQPALLPLEFSTPPDCSTGIGLGREFCSFADAVFESVSGFTTTGASVITKGLWDNQSSRRAGLPHGLLFWRAFTHFLGGMGIIVLGVAVLPLLGVGGMQLFKAEVPGPVKDKIAPKVAETARLLWKVYVVLTAIQIALMMVAGQNLFVATCHAFATMATGGFSPLAASIATLKSPSSEWIIIIFMFLAGANFSLHFLSFRRRQMLHWSDDEFRLYTFIGVGAGLIISVFLILVHGQGVHDAVRAGLFQSMSIITTTGFATEDFVLWAVGAQMVLLVVALVGGCSGSTGGGIKCVRHFLLLKAGMREMRRLTHPHAIIQTKLSGKVVKDDVIHSVAGFVMLYLTLWLFSTVIVTAHGFDIVTSLSAVIACLGNIGPGLGPVGPMGSYELFPEAIKWLLSFNMLAGRLELYSVFILLTPEFWRP
ncbi:MAG: TrkH family potassium uptake protein [Myxococcota bacterium]|nr:TrkH family potassium uptake protein [Myxococcota bacterium]